MPGLDLGSEDDFDLAVVLSAGPQQGDENAIYSERDFGTGI